MNKLLSPHLFVSKTTNNTCTPWNTHLRELTKHGNYQESLNLYRQMLRSSGSPNAFTFPVVLKSCAVLSLPIAGTQLHSHVIKTGCHSEPFVQTESLHSFVAKCGLDNDFCVTNCVLTMYVRCGSKEVARKFFDNMSVKELAAWNAMISGYAQNGYATEALELYQEFESFGMDPDPITLVGVLSSCAHLGAQKIGVEIEKRIRNSSFKHNVFVNNALINMYARCGNLVKAQEIFDGLLKKNLVSWTSIIGGYGMHGQGETTVHLFNEMIRANIRPDKTVFVSVLSACSHAGLTDIGLYYFNSMKIDYGLNPGPEHYSCVVDLLGRAGRLDDAQKIIKTMPMKPDGAVWGALLGACKIHKNIDLAEFAFDRVIELEPTNIGY